VGSTSALATFYLASHVANGFVAEFSAFGIAMAVVMGIVGLRFLLIFPKSPGIAFSVFIVSLGVRFFSVICHLRDGFRSMPRNFRRLTICTSPREIPELVPGIELTGTHFSIGNKFQQVLSIWRAGSTRIRLSILLYHGPALILWFLPGWAYRFTLKSTAWAWWPLAYLSDDLRHALFYDVLVRSLWGRTSRWMAIATLVGFAVFNVVPAAVFNQNPLLNVFGFLLLIDWPLPVWQALAILMALLCLGTIWYADLIYWEYRHARLQHDQALIDSTMRRFGRVERLVRARTVMFVFYLVLFAIQTLLYFNSILYCVHVPDRLEMWARDVYGSLMPVMQCLPSG
jgi:hypothetical protein